MKYAVITSGGKQYKVTVGQVLEIDKIKADAGSTYLFDKVLLTVDGDTVQVAKFKAKVRYRRVQGFRAHLTQVEITSLSEKNEKKTVSKTKEK